EIIEGQVESYACVEYELHAERFDEFEFPAQDGFGEAVFRNGKAKHAAGFGSLFKDGDIMTEHREIEGCCESSGASACNGDPLPGGIELAGQDPFQHGLE